MSRAGREVRVIRYPNGAVAPEDFEVVEVPVGEPGPGQVLVRNTWTSVDPGLRLRLRPDAPAGYFAAFPLGQPMDGVMAVGEVVASRSAGFAAAGAVGSLAVQIAKLCGNRVIASAGSDQKVAWLRNELGVEAFNYRDGDLAGQLRALAPESIDVYFDSVGGDHLEAALDQLNRNGRVAMCGSIAEYETGPKGPRNLFLAVSKDLMLRGFRGSSNLHLMAVMQQRIAGWLRSGELVHRETVFTGLDSAPRALAAMIAGNTTGKTLVSIG
jgi:NADPH-dependent curcumin reductase CurA